MKPSETHIAHTYNNLIGVIIYTSRGNITRYKRAKATVTWVNSHMGRSLRLTALGINSQPEKILLCFKNRTYLLLTAHDQVGQTVINSFWKAYFRTFRWPE